MHSLNKWEFFISVTGYTTRPNLLFGAAKQKATV